MDFWEALWKLGLGRVAPDPFFLLSAPHRASTASADREGWTMRGEKGRVPVPAFPY